MNQQHYQLSLGGQLNILGCRPGVCAFSTYVTYVGSTLLKRAAAIDAVRDALKLYRLEAPYQPRVALGSKGFEAIPRLRCKNGMPIRQPARNGRYRCGAPSGRINYLDNISKYGSAMTTAQPASLPLAARKECVGRDPVVGKRWYIYHCGSFY